MFLVKPLFFCPHTSTNFVLVFLPIVEFALRLLEAAA